MLALNDKKPNEYSKETSNSTKIIFDKSIKSIFIYAQVFLPQLFFFLFPLVLMDFSSLKFYQFNSTLKNRSKSRTKPFF